MHINFPQEQAGVKVPFPFNPFGYGTPPYTNLNSFMSPRPNLPFRHSGFAPSSLFPLLQAPPLLPINQPEDNRTCILQRINQIPPIPIRHSVSSQGSHSSSPEESNNITNVSPTELQPGRKKRRYVDEFTKLS